MSDSGHLLDALKGRQPEDEDPEHRLASQWRSTGDEPSSVEREAAARRARFRRPASSAEAASAEAAYAEAMEASVEDADAVLAAAEEAGEVRRTRIVAAPEATRPKADEPKRGAFAGLGAMRQAMSSALGGGRARGSAKGSAPVAVAELPSERLAPAPRPSGAKARGKVQLSHSEALLFVLVALIVVLSAYVIGKNGTGEAQAGGPAPLSRVAEDGPKPKDPKDKNPKEIVVPAPAPEPGPVNPPAPLAKVSWGVRITSYLDKAEAEKQLGVFQKGLAAGETLQLVERANARGSEFHLFVGQSEKKEDPALAALLEKFRTFAHKDGRKPYARSAEIQSF
ncbi:MAG: hypothetical protein IPN34_08210 [Planctomycetes bacterium]|nr:hypothetical protein [Planctomycetota bacterium]